MSDTLTAHHAEKCLLSSVMRGSGDVRQRAVDRMRPEMFDKHSELATTVFAVATQGKPDPDTVKAMHEDKSEVEDVLETRPDPQQITRHMREVQQAYGKREIVHLAHDAVTHAQNGHSFQETATELEKGVIDLTRKAGGSEVADSAQVLDDILQDIEDTQGQRVTGIETPFPSLDKHLRGWQDGDLIIPYGSTSMGKTAFALTSALHAAENGHAVAVHTIEMSEKSLYNRLITMETGVDLRKTRLTEKEMSRVTRAAGKINELPLYIIEASGLDYLSHRSTLRRLQYEKGIEMAVVDYLQIMSAPPSKSYGKFHHQVHDAAQGLKDTAKILEIPVITPAQTTKAPDNRKGDKKPSLSDLREAGEEPTDVAIGLYRPEYYGIEVWPSGDPTDGEGLASIDKHRNGSTGVSRLAFVKDRIRWQPLEDRRDPQEDDSAPF